MHASLRKKVLCPLEGKNGKTYWVRMGTAFQNRDGTTNVILDALPTNKKLHIRDLDERDHKKPEESGPDSSDRNYPDAFALKG